MILIRFELNFYSKSIESPKLTVFKTKFFPMLLDYSYLKCTIRKVVFQLFVKNVQLKAALQLLLFGGKFKISNGFRLNSNSLLMYTYHLDNIIGTYLCKKNTRRQCYQPCFYRFWPFFTR